VRITGESATDDDQATIVSNLVTWIYAHDESSKEVADRVFVEFGGVNIDDLYDLLETVWDGGEFSEPISSILSSSSRPSGTPAPVAYSRAMMAARAFGRGCKTRHGDSKLSIRRTRQRPKSRTCSTVRSHRA
jgi:hypothetical protein